MRGYGIILAILPITLQADVIKIENTTGQTLNAAIYYQSKEGATLATPIQIIAPRSTQTLERPERRTYSQLPLIFFDRELVVSPELSVFNKSFSSKEMACRFHVNVGDIQGNNFYIAVNKEGLLQGYNEAEWKVAKPLLEAGTRVVEVCRDIAELTSSGLAQMTKNNSIAITTNPYKDKEAVVRVGNALCEEEQAYLAHRLPRVNTALPKFLSTAARVNYTPKIALVCSGGGYRAMICTTGSLVGAEKIGLLDCVTWLVGLSGSTWALGSWMSGNVSVEEFKKQLLAKIAQPLEGINSEEFKLLVNALLVKYAFTQPLSPIDLYGCFLANRLLSNFGDARYRVYLSQQAARIRDGALPLPIYTAVRGESLAAEEDWYEYTPYEVGGAWLGMYVPTWAFGRKCEGGKSIDFAPEQTLGIQFGTFGSAYSATITRIMDEFVKTALKGGPERKAIADVIMQQIAKTIKENDQWYRGTSFGEQRFAVAEQFNFTYGMAASPVKDLKVLRLVDAGLNFNLPYPPISGERPERKADIIMLLDASENVAGAKALRKVEEYAHKKKLKFPKINYLNIEKRAVSVFKDERDLEVPVVIYMPRVKDAVVWEAHKDTAEVAHLKAVLENFDPEECVKAECGTAQFQYSQEKATQLSALTEFNMLALQEVLKQTIQWVAIKKSA